MLFFLPLFQIKVWCSFWFKDCLAAAFWCHMPLVFPHMKLHHCIYTNHKQKNKAADWRGKKYQISHQKRLYEDSDYLISLFTIPLLPRKHNFELVFQFSTKIFFPFEKNTFKYDCMTKLVINSNMQIHSSWLKLQVK